MTEKNKDYGWNFDNTYLKLTSSLFSIQQPTPVPVPEIVLYNKALGDFLGLKGEKLKSEEGAQILSGNNLPIGSMPLAQAYAGHQFGHFAILGDGRAILLGEQITPKDQRFDIQLKGSGRTPYSRGGDGRAALGPMLREYIISEAMNALGIPTTRSLAVLKTGEAVRRETDLTGALLVRVASSHIRVGTFEYISRYGSVDELKELADYTIKRHYEDLADTENPYLSLLEEMCKVQAKLIAKWQFVGFIHGVMNTDNMTLSGESIDYGPCAFMDTYNPKTVFSSIDTHGRYAYDNQPKIAAWNIARLAEALLPIIHSNEDSAIEMAQEVINKFENLYKAHWVSGMRKKLGIFNEEKEDLDLINELLNIMEKSEADYTNTFISLTTDNFQHCNLKDNDEFNQWHKKWLGRLDRQEESKELSINLRKENNPAVIPRNHRVEKALESAENGDLNLVRELLDILSCPYSYLPEQEEYAGLPPKSDKPYRTFCGT